MFARAQHWARAVGCRAEPGWLLPLEVGTALGGQVGPLAGADIRRAVAAAERRAALLPTCACAACPPAGCVSWGLAQGFRVLGTPCCCRPARALPAHLRGS